MKVSEDNLSVEMRGVDDEKYVITKNQFIGYEAFIATDMINRYQISAVAMSTGMKEEKIKLIMENYNFLYGLFMEDDDGAC